MTPDRLAMIRGRIRVGRNQLGIMERALDSLTREAIEECAECSRGTGTFYDLQALNDLRQRIDEYFALAEATVDEFLRGIQP